MRATIAERIPGTPYQLVLLQIRYYPPEYQITKSERNQRRRWWIWVKSQTWVGPYPGKHQAHLLGHFKVRQGCLAGEKEMPRVTLLPSRAIVGLRLQPTLRRPLPTPFDFHQAPLLRRVPAWLLGTTLMLAHIYSACQVLVLTHMIDDTSFSSLRGAPATKQSPQIATPDNLGSQWHDGRGENYSATIPIRPATSQVSCPGIQLFC
jgi:hypothetical protein